MVKEVEILEVGARDGLQNVKTFVKTEHKIEIIKKLMDCGFKEIEIASFVSPKWVPQMADAAEVVAEAKKYRKEKGYTCKFIGVAPNTRGFENASAAGIESVIVPISVIERNNKENVNRTRKESFEALEAAIKTFGNMEFNVGLACALGTPYGDSDPVIKDELFRMAEHCFEIGASTINIADTVGNGTPMFAEEIFSELHKYVDYNNVHLHLHDSLGRSLVNTAVALKHGIKIFESAVGGLGGCPFAPGAAGNVATEDLISYFDSIGVKTGLDLNQVLDVVETVEKYV